MIMRGKHAADFSRIQNETLRDERLSTAARGLLVYMLSMSDDWVFSVAQLAKSQKLSRPKIIALVKELENAGYITIENKRGKLGQFSGSVWTVYETPKDHSQENRSTGKLTTANTAVKKTEVRQNRSTENLTDKNYQLNKNYQLDKNYQDIKSSTTRTRESFTPPTLEDVTAYCLERKNNVDPQRWLDHYQSNGWRVGKNPMKDWKAAVRTWERSGFNDTPRKPTPPHPAKAEESKIDEALRIAMQRAEGGAV